MITDTLHGNSIDFSAKRLGLHHQAAFDMRHKFLLALLELPEARDICLSEVSEFDVTFVLSKCRVYNRPTGGNRIDRVLYEPLP